MAWAIDWTHQLEIRRQYGVDGHRLGNAGAGENRSRKMKEPESESARDSKMLQRRL